MPDTIEVNLIDGRRVHYMATVERELAQTTEAIAGTKASLKDDCARRRRAPIRGRMTRTEQILAALVVVVAGAMLVLGLAGWRDR